MHSLTPPHKMPNVWGAVSTAPPGSALQHSQAGMRPAESLHSHSSLGRITRASEHSAQPPRPHYHIQLIIPALPSDFFVVVVKTRS